ncbi:hypothetical protein HK097_009683 [Rhizophlyctis rosea]|uniref:Anoctamin transmembrane domain-containing protein n=1 Tax=Rhizophlyctis rosea TaxID=64517 RepID=A0AAD5S8K6_9FUNG|nr:hypothetical protein HK097_009683 [Rhizophlyctis rosea]
MLADVEVYDVELGTFSRARHGVGSTGKDDRSKLVRNERLVKYGDDELGKDFNQKVIQLGFLMLFGVAPFCARAPDVGRWTDLAIFVSTIAVPVNALIIAFGSTAVHNMLAGWWKEHIILAKVVFVFVFEHLVLIIKATIMHYVPDTPPNVRRAIQGQMILARVPASKQNGPDDSALRDAVDIADASFEDEEVERGCGCFGWGRSKME